MDDKISGVDPNKGNSENPESTSAPVDPSNTGDIGQQVEQGVVSTHEGISEQSARWEDQDERDAPKKR